MQANGNIVGLNLKDVMVMLGSVKKDGCLTVTSENKGGEIIFSGGKIINVTVDGDPSWVDVLYSEGLVGKDVFSAENKKDLNLIKGLRQRLSSQGEAVDLITKFYVDEIYSVISLDDVGYQFETCEIKDIEASGVAVDVGVVLSGIEKCEEEWRRVYHVIPSLGSYADLSEDISNDQDIMLSPDEWRLIVRLREPQSIEDLKSEVGLPLLRLCKKLIDLHERGLVEFLKADSEEVAKIQSGQKGKYVKKSKGKSMPLEWSSYYEQLDDKAEEEKKKDKTKVVN